MKFIRYSLLGLLFSCTLGSQISADLKSDYDFQPERMQLASDSVIVVSSFETQDHVTAYTLHGLRLWNAPFHAKILSWELYGNNVFVFSKSRQGTSTYLTCIDRFTGELIWQRP